MEGNFSPCAAAAAGAAPLECELRCVRVRCVRVRL